ncbi:hypothetical protein KY284_025278 [Solanum tuberosum]|nr:hypothetical protein KY284_025278 [Solanum tuberosum]
MEFRRTSSFLPEEKLWQPLVELAYHAELLALLHGLTLAKEKNLKRIDSQVLRTSLNNNNTLYSHITLIAGLYCSSWKYVPPLKANRTADALAELGRKSKDPPMTRNYLYFLDASPSSITNVLERDAIGTTSLRSVPVCMDDPYL